MTTANTLAALVNGNSEVVVPSGGINFGTSTDGTGSVTSGVMDDFEEGTWSPTIENVSGSEASFGSQNGVYTKIGDLVICQGQVVYSGGNGLSDTDWMSIGGYPFTMGTATFNAQFVELTSADVAIFCTQTARTADRTTLVKYTDSTESTSNLRLNDINGTLSAKFRFVFIYKI